MPYEYNHDMSCNAACRQMINKCRINIGIVMLHPFYMPSSQIFTFPCVIIIFTISLRTAEEHGYWRTYRRLFVPPQSVLTEAAGPDRGTRPSVPTPGSSAGHLWSPVIDGGAGPTDDRCHLLNGRLSLPKRPSFASWVCWIGGGFDQGRTEEETGAQKTPLMKPTLGRAFLGDNPKAKSHF